MGVKDDRITALEQENAELRAQVRRISEVAAMQEIELGSIALATHETDTGYGIAHVTTVKPKGQAHPHTMIGRRS